MPIKNRIIKLSKIFTTIKRFFRTKYYKIYFAVLNNAVLAFLKLFYYFKNYNEYTLFINFAVTVNNFNNMVFTFGVRLNNRTAGIALIT